MGSGGGLWDTLDLISMARMNQKTIIISATEPTTTYPGQLWYDTTNSILKVRNAANTAWDSVGTAHNLLSNTHLDTLSAAVVRGDLVTGRITNTTLAWTRLPIGAENKTLISNGVDVDWGLITNANIDTNALIAYTKLNLSGEIVNADININALIAYSKLNLTGEIVDADINTVAGIVYSKLNLTGAIVNADINTGAAIVYSKLNITGGIVNADINTAAAIVYSKLNLAGNIVNADINTAAGIDYSKLNLTGAIVNLDINTTAGIAYIKLDLSDCIVNADINVNAGIAYTKMNAGTQNLLLAGLIADRPTAEISGRLYYATDEYIWYRDTGTAWVINTFQTGQYENLSVAEAKIGNLAVTNAKINDLDAIKINAGYLSADRV